MKLQDFRRYMAEELYELYGSDEATAIASGYLREKHENLFPFTSSSDQYDISDSLLGNYMSDLQELREGKPLQYVLGYQWFCNRKLIVNEHVLIPRPETEEMVHWILSECTLNNLYIIDIGSGSGCIPIAIKAAKPDFTVFATDISPSALATAKKNAQIYNLDIYFIEDDILNTGISGNIQFDLIISNPPYILPSEADGMHINVKKFEPALALFTPADDPLIYYRAIIDFSLSRLAPDGLIYFEINKSHADELKNLLSEAGFSEVLIRKDISDNIRFIRASRH